MASSATGQNNGVALYASGLAHLDVVDTDFTENGVALLDGVGSSSPSRGGMNGAVAYVNATPCRFERCEFRGNRGTYINKEGGLVTLNGACGGSAFTNCLFVGNEEMIGYSMTYSQNDSWPRDSTVDLRLDSSDATVDFENCTFAYNLTGGWKAVGGIACEKGAIRVSDSIFFGNVVSKNQTTDRDLYFADGAATCETNYCSFGADPKFVTPIDTATWVNAAGNVPYYRQTDEARAAVLAADCHLAFRSPAIDAGDPKREWRREPSVPGVKTNGRRANLGAYGNTSEAAYSTSLGTQFLVR